MPLESDSPAVLSNAEISEYSIRYHLKQKLVNNNWLNINVMPTDEGWPVYESVVRPGIYVWMGPTEDKGVELGSYGSELIVSIYIFAMNDAQRTRLAELIRDMFRKSIPIYNYVTGNEVTPDPLDNFFVTDSIGWQKIPHNYNAPEAERFRATVTAILRRIE